ncbi:MAG: peptidylprolyl isomerase [Rhodospirillaceae bacterium]
MKSRIALLLCASIGIAASVAPAGAQQRAAVPAMSIAAVVNDEIVTVREVQNRMGLFMATARIENSPEVQRRLVPQVIDALIDERLKMQEARRLKVTVTTEEVRAAVNTIEDRNGMAPGTLRAMMDERGIDMDTLYAQIESDSVWVKVAQEHLAREVVVTAAEVKSVIDRAKANQGKPEYLLSEIVIPISLTLPEQAARELGQRLVQQIRDGAPFQAAAQQFSQSATAAVGGDLGWVIQNDLEGDLAKIVPTMAENQISDPIRVGDAFRILALRGKRASGEPDPQAAAITMTQIYLPTEGGRALPPDKLEAYAERIMREPKTCDDMNKLAAEIKTPGSGAIPPVYVGALPEKVRDAVVNLPVNKVSDPIGVTAARLYVMVCARQADTGVPNEGQVRNMLENSKLNNIARQKLRDLRRQALIDVRL